MGEDRGARVSGGADVAALMLAGCCGHCENSPGSLYSHAASRHSRMTEAARPNPTCPAQSRRQVGVQLVCTGQALLLLHAMTLVINGAVGCQTAGLLG